MTNGSALHDLQRRWIFAWTASAILTWGLFFLQARIGVNLADEGYLWYGVWRSLLGEIPRVDFRSYDPVRVWWVADWCRIFGFGPVGIRAGIAVFQMVGLACGILAASRVVKRFPTLTAVAFMLALWMQPRHKLFEPAIAMVAVYVGVLFLEKPSLRRAFLVGAVVGLAATFRRNHGVYMVLALAPLVVAASMAAGTVRNGLRAAAVFGVGICAGFSPVWLSACFVPGFARAYLESVTVILSRGVTNQALAVPWPWRVSPGQGGWLETATALATGVGFILLVAAPVLALVALVWGPQNTPASRRLLIASGAIGATYAHHALVRSDLGHLTQAIHPALLVFVALTAMLRCDTRSGKWVIAAVVSSLVIVTALAPIPAMPIVHRMTGGQAWEERTLMGDRLWLRRSRARLIDAVATVSDRTGPGPKLFLAPDLPGLYPIIGRPAPVWDPYPLWPTSASGEAEMIRSIEASEVEWAVVLEREFAGSRFQDNYPLLWSWMASRYHRTHVEGLRQHYGVFELVEESFPAAVEDRDDTASHNPPVRENPTSGMRHRTATTRDGS